MELGSCLRPLRGGAEILDGVRPVLCVACPHKDDGVGRYAAMDGFPLGEVRDGHLVVAVLKGLVGYVDYHRRPDPLLNGDLLHCSPALVEVGGCVGVRSTVLVGGVAVGLMVETGRAHAVEFGLELETVDRRLVNRLLGVFIGQVDPLAFG